VAREYQIRIRGQQREHIDADLMAQLVIMFGRELARDAEQVIDAVRQAEAEDARRETDPESNKPASGGTS
jgi:hypothetical protein